MSPAKKGGPGLDYVLARSVVEIEEIPVPLICVRHLIMLKRRAGRPADREDIRRLSRLP